MFCYNNQAVASGGPQNGGANLENDTEKREKRARGTAKRVREGRSGEAREWDLRKRGLRKTVRFEELNATKERESGGFGEPKGVRFRKWKRIKHQSLILAQDERWRRA